MESVSDLKSDFVVVVLNAEVLSKFSQNWIVLRLENITQYVDERVGQVLQSLKGLESLINLISSLARDLGLYLLSVLFD